MGILMKRTARNLPAALYIALVGIVGAAILAMSSHNLLGAWKAASLPAWVAIAALTVLIGRLSLRLPLPVRCRLSFADGFIVLSYLVFGADFATLIGALDGLSASPRGQGSGPKKLFNTTGMAIAVHLSARLVDRMIRDAGASDALMLSPAHLVMATVVLAAAQYAVNSALVAGVVALTEHVSQVSVWQGTMPWAATCWLAGSVGALLVFAVNPRAGISSAFSLLPFALLLYLACRAGLHKGRLVKVHARH